MLTALPSEGFTGEAPEYPLPDANDREMQLWAQVWRTPQACAWAVQPWRHYIVGQWVRWSVKSEAADASAALVAAVIRFADQIGLTPAGLKENGWAIATDDLAKRRAETEPRPEVPAASARDRMKVVNRGDDG